MTVKKFIFSTLLLALLGACSSKEDDAKKLGFSSVGEMTRLQALGFKSQKDVDADVAKKQAEEERIAAEKKKEGDLKQIEASKALLIQKVSACGWKSAPESAGFFLGMTYSQVQSFASANGYALKCKESAPITGGTVTEMVQKMMNDEFSVNRDWRASNLCETIVDGNEISLYLFKTKSNGEPILGKAYNSLDKYKKSTPADTYMAAVPVMEALSEKYGFEMDKRNECSVDSGEGYRNTFSTTFARPYPDRTPNQPNISLFFTVSDKSVIEIGGALTKARDEAAQNTTNQAEKNNLRSNASKL